MAYSIVINGVGTIGESGIAAGSIRITTAVDIVGAELAADVFSVIVNAVSGGDSLLQPSDRDGFLTSDGDQLYVSGGGIGVTGIEYGTPLFLYNDSTLVGKFYVRNVVRTGRTMFKINAMSAIGFLENQKHYGGLYTNVTAADVISEIIDGAFTYTVDPTVAVQQIRGWLPIDTKRNNLHKLLFAIGASVVKDSSGNIKFVFLNGGNPSNIPSSRIFMGSTIDYPDAATAAETTEHSFYQTPSDPVEQLYDTLSVSVTNAIVEFNEPHYDLSATGTLVINDSGVNWADVSGSGILSGKKYTHEKKIVRKVSTASSQADKTVSSHDDTLVNALNSGSVVDRLLAYYSSKTAVNASIKVASEKSGDVVSFVNAFGESTSGIITQMDTIASTFMKSTARIITGYTPTGQGNNFANRAIVTTNGGTWTVPSGVSRVRMVLIAPGNGGNGGYDGANGSAPNRYGQGETRYPDDQWYDAEWISWTGQTAAQGGAGGSGGQQGKVYVTELDVTQGQTFTIAIGSRGSAGTRNGGSGGTGGATSVSGAHSASTATDGTLVNGYLDPITNDIYALPGADGENGGNGGMSDIASIVASYGADGYPGNNAVTGNGGSGGTGRYEMVGGNRWRQYNASGGGGGGGAHGADGSNGGNASFSSGTVQGGNGGNGASAVAPSAVLYGCGGGGGHGGGGGGNGGAVDSNYYTDIRAGAAGSGGQGTAGAQGGAGCAIFYY